MYFLSFSFLLKKSIEFWLIIYGQIIKIKLKFLALVSYWGYRNILHPKINREPAWFLGNQRGTKMRPLFAEKTLSEKPSPNITARSRYLLQIPLNTRHTAFFPRGYCSKEIVWWSCRICRIRIVNINRLIKMWHKERYKDRGLKLKDSKGSLRSRREAQRAKNEMRTILSVYNANQQYNLLYI